MRNIFVLLFVAMICGCQTQPPQNSVQSTVTIGSNNIGLTGVSSTSIQDIFASKPKIESTTISEPIIEYHSTTYTTIEVSSTTSIAEKEDGFDQLFQRLEYKRNLITTTTTTSTTVKIQTTTTTIWTSPDYVNKYWVPEPGDSYHVDYPKVVDRDTIKYTDP